MNAIALFDGTMIIREIRRMVHRNDDMLVVDLAIEPCYGATISEDLYRKQRVLTLQVTKDRYPDLWAELKDATNDALIVTVAVMLNQALPVVAAYNEEDSNPTYRKAIQETMGDGSIKYWYEDEYVLLAEGETNEYESAMKRTGHSPVNIRQPNSHAAELAELEETYPVVEFRSAIDYLLSIDVTTPLTVEELG